MRFEAFCGFLVISFGHLFTFFPLLDGAFSFSSLTASFSFLPSFLTSYITNHESRITR